MNYRNFKLLVLFIFSVVFFQRLITSAFPLLKFAEFFDELLVLIFNLIVFHDLYVNKKTNKLAVLIYATYAYMVIVSLIIGKASLLNIFIQSFIHLKFFCSFYIFIRLFESTPTRLIRYMKTLFFLTLIGLFLNLVFQANFNFLFDQEADYRGWLRLVGFQLRANTLAATIGLIYLYYTFGTSIGRVNISRFLILTLLFSVLILLTGNRTTLIVIMVSIFFYFKDYVLRKPIVSVTFLGLFILSFAILLTTTDIYSKTVENLKESTDPEGHYIRGLMIYYSLILFADYFPVGPGSSTYGSALSEGSIVYDELGIGHRYYFIEMWGVFDSNVATIVGEFGLMGIIIFFFLLKEVYTSSIKGARRSKIVYTQLLMAFILIYGLLNPVFMHSYTSLIFSLVFSINKLNKENTYEGTYIN